MNAVRSHQTPCSSTGILLLCGDAMTSFLRFFSFSLSIMLVTTFVTPNSVFADCKEFRIVETDDRVEVVCVGDPPTPAQLKAKAEDEKRQELENKRQKTEADRRQKDAEIANAKIKAQEEAARKKPEVKPVPPRQPVEKSGINMQTPPGGGRP